MLLLELRVHEVERLAEFRRAVLECLLKEVSGAFEFLPAISFDEFGEVDVPDFKGDGEVEQLNTPFVNLEGFFEVLVLLEETCKIDDGLGVCDFELHDLVIDCLGRLNRADRFLEIGVV